MKLVNGSIKNYVLRSTAARIHFLISTRILLPIMFPIRGQNWIRDEQMELNKILLGIIEPVQAEMK